MPCIGERGKLLSLGKMVLKSLMNKSQTPEEITEQLSSSLPLIRSGLRELKNSSYVIQNGDKFEISEKGKKIFEKGGKPF